VVAREIDYTYSAAAALVRPPAPIEGDGVALSCTLGIDIGTSSSKGVLVGPDGTVLRSASVPHEVDRPAVGHVEMDADVWWAECVALTRELLDGRDGAAPVEVAAVGVSGMGPCVLLTDDDDRPVRPAILYGVDTRAGEQIERLTAALGAEEIVRVGGSALTSQAGGPKIAWVRDAEPAAYARARRVFQPASWLVRRLTGAYVLDHQSASQLTPLYDVAAGGWYAPWWDACAAGIEPPELRWAGEVAGRVTPAAAAATGLAPGTPVLTGTIDAWAEAVSVGAHGEGDLMLMYGTTMFLVATGRETLRSPALWTTVGALPGTRNLAGGLATSGALAAWVSALTGADHPTLLAEAAASPPGADGLLVLPYFAGERTPVLDPDARGVVAGLTLRHTRGDLYRAALEATAHGVRHNVDAMRAAGADIRRVVAVGGGTRGGLWLQVVSDVTGLEQEVPAVTVGASYGMAYLAACATAARPPRIEDWNPVASRVAPDPARAPGHAAQHDRYLRLYADTRDVVHELARQQHTGRTPA